MQELHLEISILSPESLKRKKRYSGPLVRFFLNFILFFEELVVSIDRVFENLRVKKILSDPVTKICIAIMLNMLMLHLVLNGTLLAATINQIENGENVVTNTIQKDIDIDKLEKANDGGQLNSANYLISPKEKCDKSEESKKSSELCGKDQVDEKSILEIKKMDNAEKARLAQVNYQPRRISCREDGYGHPSNSSTKGKHMDEDCCPDPDEWPKPGCVYDAHSYGIMLSGPVKKK